jgi:GTPase SAR1 family protein
MMGSVRQRLSETRHDCNVVLVGDCRVGKSSLVNRFVNTKFSEVGKQ